LGVNRPSWRGDTDTGHASLVDLGTGGASLSLVGEEMTVSAFTTSSSALDRSDSSLPGFGAMVEWHGQEQLVGFRLGALREGESALGADAGGAFGELASSTAFLGVGIDGRLGGWHTSLEAEIGSSSARVGAGLIDSVSRVSTTSFQISGERDLGDYGRIRLALSQPLRVEGGRMSLRVPVGRTKAGDVVYERAALSLAPSGRQHDLSALWTGPRDELGGEMRLGMVWSHQPGHTLDNSPEITLMAGYSLGF